MNKYGFRIYIPFAGNPGLLNKCITSIIPQMKEWSSWDGKKIVVINNSMKPLLPLLEHPEEVEIWELPFELTQAQEYNWMNAIVIKEGQPFCLNTHTDTVLLPRAIETAIEKYEEIKGTKWYAYGVGGSVFVAFNPQFFIEEDVWNDPFLFPFYYMDNHMGRVAKFRGWADYTVMKEYPLVEHVRSHTLEDDPIFRRKNSIAFKYHGGIYAEIWGGLPGKETINDPYASGTLPRKE
jgi:hypothetical protein